jgi:hypothetical protein
MSSKDIDRVAMFTGTGAATIGTASTGAVI